MVPGGVSPTRPRTPSRDYFEKDIDDGGYLASIRGFTIHFDPAVTFWGGAITGADERNNWALLVRVFDGMTTRRVVVTLYWINMYATDGFKDIYYGDRFGSTMPSYYVRFCRSNSYVHVLSLAANLRKSRMGDQGYQVLSTRSK